jgi:hypothetical protein
MDSRRTLRGSTTEAVLQFLKPHVKLGGLTLLAATPLAVVAMLVPQPLVLPVVSLAAIAAGGLAALIAWLIRAKRRGNTITSWDVAGACVLIGCAAAMLSDPENVLNLLGAP